jgi:hypothetical protein
MKDNFKTMEQLMNEIIAGGPETAKELEQAFRRGYAHGAETVISAMLEILQKRTPIETVIAMCNAFQYDVDRWRRGELEGSTPLGFAVRAYVMRVYEQKNEDEYQEEE